MATDPLKKSDRIFQKPFERGDIQQSVKLIDVDYAIMRYLEDVALPKVSDNGVNISIPVLYGNSERWNQARRDGILRDKKGKLQLPLVVIRRSNVAKSDTMPMLNRQVSYSTIKKYSSDNRYDRFSLLSGKTSPKMELYNITMPDYVEVTYECMGWTNYTEQLNSVIEAMSFASDEYWGDKTKFKFNTTVSDFDVTNEVTEGSERINRATFTLTVKAYLLPERFDGQVNVKKSYGSVRIVTNETDATAAGRLEASLISPSAYYDNKDLIDFLSLNESISQNPVSNDTITFMPVKLIPIPSELASAITSTLTIDSIGYDIKLYINGTRYYYPSHFTATYNSSTYQLIITFLPVGLGFNVTSLDEITITGKFLDLA